MLNTWWWIVHTKLWGYHPHRTEDLRFLTISEKYLYFSCSMPISDTFIFCTSLTFHNFLQCLLWYSVRISTIAVCRHKPWYLAQNFSLVAPVASYLVPLSRIAEALFHRPQFWKTCALRFQRALCSRVFCSKYLFPNRPGLPRSDIYPFQAIPIGVWVRFLNPFLLLRFSIRGRLCPTSPPRTGSWYSRAFPDKSLYLYFFFDESPNQYRRVHECTKRAFDFASRSWRR